MEAVTQRRGLGLAMILLANVLAGATYPAQKLALEGLTPGVISLVRTVAGATLMMLWYRSRRRTDPRSQLTRADLGRVLALGVVAYGMPMWLGTIGVERSTATNGSILTLLEPVMVILLSWAYLRERIGWRKLSGVALGLGGALVIVTDAFGGHARDSLSELVADEYFVGNVLLALHGLMWGLYAPIVKPLMDRGRDPVVISLWTALASLAVHVPVAGSEIAGGLESGPELAPALAWTAFLALAGSFGATILWVYALRHIRASTTAPCVFVQPITGGVMGAWLMGETLGTSSLVGGLLIAIGVALAILRRD